MPAGNPSGFPDITVIPAIPLPSLARKIRFPCSDTSTAFTYSTLMYLKLMTRGLLRYRKRGRRFFVLIMLCSAALVFFR